jgi:hypothetical protein
MMGTFFLAACGGSSGEKKDGKDSEGKEKKEESSKKEDEAKKKEQEASNARWDEEGVVQKGAEFDTAKSFEVTQLPGKIGDKDSLSAKVHGKVLTVCQKKGCWMEMKMGEDHPNMMVRFKDYAFFVPKDASGSHAVMKGWAFKDTLSVKQQRHYAKDKGKSQEAIDSIQEPKVRLAFKASGVMLEKKEEE